MIDIARHITLRIATPEASGSAFYIKGEDLIITAAHIIQGYGQVIIEGSEVPKQLAEVVFIDSLLDLAFIQPVAPLTVPICDIEEGIDEEDEIIAYAYPFRSSEALEKGMVDDPKFLFHGVPHILHDAVLDNAANGSALLSIDGKLLGLNNFITWKGRHVGMTLPINQILDSIHTYRSSGMRIGTVCSNCKALNDASIKSQCGKCQEKISAPKTLNTYKAKGVGKTIETLLESMGYTLELSRIGPDHWEIERGSAAVSMTYFEKNGLIIGDAYMCKLPPQSNLELYEFLLRQNHEMENLTFSVKGDDIILSLLIYDRYLNEHTGTELLTTLLERADRFDNILVEQYQCLWTSSRKLT